VSTISNPTGGKKEGFLTRLRKNSPGVFVLSVLAHVVFILGATYLVVQTINSRPKQNFTSAAPGPKASTRALEHEVKMAKQKTTMSAPRPMQRIATTGLSKVTLPEMPDLPSMDVSPTQMAGIGGAGVTPGASTGGAGGGGGGGGGGFTTPFGIRGGNTKAALEGYLYDLKQDKRGKPNNISDAEFGDVVSRFVNSSFSEAVLSKYYRVKKPLYALQMFVPVIGANEAPRAFGVEREVQPRLWIAVYRGKVIPSESGKFYLAGSGDDYLIVRFNNKIILDGGIYKPVGGSNKEYHYKGGGVLVVSSPITVKAGQEYPIEILIGERPGGYCAFSLMIQQDGVEYRKDESGSPILPIFKWGKTKAMQPTGGAPPFQRVNGPVWSAKAPPEKAPPAP
jgi:hypothetical protein